MRQGYLGFETSVKVAAGGTFTVNAELEQLVDAGSARIEVPNLEGAEVYVDGAPVGTAPWEGALEPGEHHYFVRLGDRGSAPESLFVRKGQTVIGKARVLFLGPELRLTVDPPTAELFIDGVSVGRGSWQGRLPLDEHELYAQEGDQVARKTLSIDAQSRGGTTIRLGADEQAPGGDVREEDAAENEGKVLLEAFGGVAATPSLRSDAETPGVHCRAEDCELVSRSGPLGFLLGARAAYEFPFHLSVGGLAGYLSVSTQLERRLDSFFEHNGDRVDYHYGLTDELHLGGPFFGAAVGYRVPITSVLELRTNLGAGAVLVQARDAVIGTATSRGRTVPVDISRSNRNVSAVDVFIMPEVQLGLRFDGFGVGLGLMTAFVLDVTGLDHATEDLEVEGSCQAHINPTAVDCAPDAGFIAREDAYDAFTLWVPSLTAGYAF